MATFRSFDALIAAAIADTKRKTAALNRTEIRGKGTLPLPIARLTVDTSDVEKLTDDLDEAGVAYIRDISQDIAAKLDASLVSYKLVKTGKLRDSLVVDVTKNSVVFSYQAPYAALLQYGGYIKPYGNPNAPKVYIPPRPWVDDVFDSYDFEEKFRI